MEPDKKYALVTGASSGIGKAIAFNLGSRGHNLILVSLPGENLESVASEIKSKFKVNTDFFETDLSTRQGPESVFRFTTEKQYPVNILVNNAGVAGTSVFINSDPAYSDTRIMVNIRALVLLTRLYLPDLKNQDKSFIMNIGSLSAFFSIPYKAVYSASKAFVVNFSRAIRYELKDTNVKISVVCPNGVRTNFGTNARIDAHGVRGKITSVPVDLLAERAVDNMLKGKFLYIPLMVNHFLLLLSKIIPTGIQQKILTREFLKEVKVS